MNSNSDTRKNLRSGVLLKQYAARLLVVAVSMGLFDSCPAAIQQSMIDQANDEIAPVISIPDPPSVYANDVTIDGTVTDSADAEGAAGEVTSLEYEVIGTPKTGSVAVDDGGAFSVTIDTMNLSGDITVRFSATDWHENRETYDLDLLDDGAGPYVTFTSPEEESFYAGAVSVEGTVANSTTDSDTDEVSSLSYEVLSSSITGELTEFGDGEFAFQFSTSELTDSIVVRVTAVDYNENTSQTDLTLLDGGSEIPSLRAVSGNGEITLTWDDVPFTDGYTLYYTDNGSMPSESNGSELVIGDYPDGGSYTVTDLENGRVHGFKLKAASTIDEEENWSALVEAIPLSEFTLAPMVRSGNGSVELSWPEVTGWNEYVVYRSDAVDGPFFDLTGRIDETEYVDSGITAGVDHFYRIEPTMDGSGSSAPGWGRAYEAPRTIDGVVGTTSITDSSAFSGEHKLIMRGTTGYGIMEDRNFRVIDYSDPTDPAVIWEYDYGSEQGQDVPYDDLAVNDSYAFTISSTGAVGHIGHEGIHVYDIVSFGLKDTITSDDADSSIFGANIDPGSLEAVAAMDGYLFLLQGAYIGFSIKDYNIHVIDIAYLDDPAVPEPVFAAQDLLSPAASIIAADMCIDGDSLYVIYRDESPAQLLTVLDISDPTSPVTRGSCDIGTSPLDIAVVDGYAYVTGNSSGEGMLKVVDVSDPDAPTVVGTDQSSRYLSSDNFDLRNGYGYFLYMSSINVLNILNLLDPADPFIAGQYAVTGMWAAAASDDYVYALGESYLKTMDLSNQPYPEVVGSSDLGGSGTANDVRVYGSYAYVAAGTAGLVVVDLSTPAAPTITGSVDTGDAAAVWQTGGYCFVTDSSANELDIVDVSDPVAPAEVGSCSLSYTPADIQVLGDYAYVAGDGGIEVVDISDVTSPRVTATESTTNAQGLYAEEGYLYVADDSSGIKVFSAGGSDTPILAGQKSLSGVTAYSIYKRGDTLLVGTSTGMELVEVSEPTLPDQPTIHTIDLDPWPSADPNVTGRDLTILGGFAFVAGHDAGCVMVDISNLNNPVVVNTFKASAGGTYEIAGYGDYLVLAEGTAGLRIIDPWPDK